MGCGRSKLRRRSASPLEQQAAVPASQQVNWAPCGSSANHFNPSFSSPQQPAPSSQQSEWGPSGPSPQLQRPNHPPRQTPASSSQPDGRATGPSPRLQPWDSASETPDPSPLERPSSDLSSLPERLARLRVRTASDRQPNLQADRWAMRDSPLRQGLGVRTPMQEGQVERGSQASALSRLWAGAQAEPFSPSPSPTR
jgi:hypothetical protein